MHTMPLQVTDLELARLYCNQDTRSGVFAAPCGTLTKEPRMTHMQVIPGRVLDAEAAGACPRLAALLAARPGAGVAALRQRDQHVTPRPHPGAALAQASAVLTRILQDLQTPCSIPGCEGWRAELRKAYAALPPDCTTCDRNTVLMRFVRSYTPVMEAFLAAHPDFDLQPARPGQESAP